jgi:hypothetical protein
LPVRVVEAGDTHGAQLQQGVSERARELHRRENGDSRGEPTAAADELDALVRQLYRVELHELSNGVS